MGNAPSTGLRTGGAGLNTGFGLTKPSAYQYTPAKQFHFGDVSPANTNTSKKQYGFYSTTTRPRCVKDDGNSGKSGKEEKVTFEKPFQDDYKPSQAEQIKNDPRYKQFIEEWKTMVPRMEMGEGENDDDLQDAANNEDNTPTIAKSTATTTATASATSSGISYASKIGQSGLGKESSVWKGAKA